MTDPHRRDSRAAFRYRDFRLLLISSCLAGILEQMMFVAIGWELYDRTGSTLYLGLVGLVQVIPVILLALPAGHIVDRYDRKLIAVGSYVGVAVAAGGLTLLSWTTGPLVLVFGCLFCLGIARAFQSPSTGALIAQVVPPEHYGNAATWESSGWQASSIVGPALGGFVIALHDTATPAYAITAGGLVIVAGMTLLLRLRPVERVIAEKMSKDSLLAGLRFVFATKVILAAITLDMVAVLLGGATALLPVFAKDVLYVGANGLGWMRAAPAIGAVTAAVVLAHRPPFKHAGPVLLLVVSGFGFVTIVFGFSRSFALSLVALAALGALDNVSVVIRNTLMLTKTPEDVRGRVNAVHFVFIGLSNEMGAFESGVAAWLLGAVGAVVAGGIGTVLVVPLIALAWPAIRKLGRLQPNDEVMSDGSRVMDDKPVAELAAAGSPGTSVSGTADAIPHHP
jgi:MFS family permease